MSAKTAPKPKKRRRRPPKPRPQPRYNGKHPGGRPPLYDPDKNKAVGALCALGATDNDIADFLEVDPVTIWRWKGEYPEFCKLLTRGKELADDMVHQRLFSRAVGYSHSATKVFMPSGAEKPVYAPYIEHIPPDVTAQIFWLKNRRPKEWRERMVMAGDPDAPLIPDQDPKKIEIRAMFVTMLNLEAQGLLPADPKMIDVTPVGPKKANGSTNGSGKA